MQRLNAHQGCLDFLKPVQHACAVSCQRNISLRPLGLQPRLARACIKQRYIQYGGQAKGHLFSHRIAGASTGLDRAWQTQRRIEIRLPRANRGQLCDQLRFSRADIGASAQQVSRHSGGQRSLIGRQLFLTLTFKHQIFRAAASENRQRIIGAFARSFQYALLRAGPRQISGHTVNVQRWGEACIITRLHNLQRLRLQIERGLQQDKPGLCAAQFDILEGGLTGYQPPHIIDRDTRRFEARHRGLHSAFVAARNVHIIAKRAACGCADIAVHAARQNRVQLRLHEAIKRRQQGRAGNRDIRLPHTHIRKRDINIEVLFQHDIHDTGKLRIIEILPPIRIHGLIGFRIDLSEVCVRYGNDWRLGRRANHTALQHSQTGDCRNRILHSAGPICVSGFSP